MKRIVLCASVTAYKQVIEVKHQLEKVGFKVLVPDMALEMERLNDYSMPAKQGAAKAEAIRKHFDKIAKSEAVLIVNMSKQGIEGYIGPNVLMEMGLAFYLKKPIYLLNSLDPKSLVKEEVEAMKPIYLNGKLEKIPIYEGSN